MVGARKGWREFSHGGGDAGYQTYLTAFPDLKMGFIVVGNVSDLNPTDIAYKIADLFIKDTSAGKQESKKEQRDSSLAILKDPVSIQKYVGDYISQDGVPMKFGIRQKKLYNHIYGQTHLLVKEKNDTFSIINLSGDKIHFWHKWKRYNGGYYNTRSNKPGQKVYKQHIRK